MHRFFVDKELLKKEQFEITDENVKHMVKVLRLKPEDKVILADGEGSEVEAVILETEKKRVLVKVLKNLETDSEPPIKITLLQGLPKKDKFEFIIQKGTELGINRFIPLNTLRTIVKLDPKKLSNRQKRWQKIAEEAAKQCGRAVIPPIEKVTTLEEALKSLEADLLLFPWENEKTLTLKEVLQRETPSNINSIALFIGPEGGWDPKESELAKSYGAKLVSLGPRILRTETAGIAVAAVLLYQLGDLGG